MRISPCLLLLALPMDAALLSSHRAPQLAARLRKPLDRSSRR
jgi:hypothetical protein